MARGPFAIYDVPSEGPTFGGAPHSIYELSFYGRGGAANFHINGYYIDTTGVGSALFGGANFAVNEVEVFSVS